MAGNSPIFLFGQYYRRAMGLLRVLALCLIMLLLVS